MIVLRFPPTGGGEEHGLNDAGVETFEGKAGHYAARECSQNVGDAVAPGVETVRMEFSLILMPAEAIPCLADLKATFTACREFWMNNKKTREFFEAALTKINCPTIPVLKVSDYGTTGLTGADSDRQDKWYCLVRSGGVSNKEGGSGGSFGIGKFAPFAASTLRTVFYSTRTIQGRAAFQGVGRLVSHRGPDGETTQGTGYIGIYDPSSRLFKAVRNETDIPTAFRREQPGTDIYILAFRDTEDWEKHITYSILKNFWPAIHKKIIEFKVGNTPINHQNLATKLQEFAAEEDFEAHLYYEALTSPSRLQFETDIEGLGTVQLHLVAGAEGYPKRVALTRKTGMVIDWKRFTSRKPFSGYFVCETENGNQLFRSIEPPRHDTWDPDRGGRPEKRTLRQLFDWIRACIKELNPVSTATSLDVPDLARFLPDDGEDNQEQQPVPQPSQGQTEPGFRATPTTEPVQIRVHYNQPAIPPVFINDGGTEGPGTGGGGGNGGNGGGGGQTTPGDSGGNRRSRREDPERRPKLSLRSFLQGSRSYQLIIRTDMDYTGPIRLLAIGEDGQAEQPAISEARLLPHGQQLETQGRCTINQVPLTTQQPTRLSVTLNNRTKLALNAITA